MVAADMDLFDASQLLAPYDGYATLREQGAIVWLGRYGMWAAPRYESCTAILRNSAVFSSEVDGVAMTPLPHDVVRSTLTTDEPEHARLRGLVAQQLRPASLRALQDEIEREASGLVERLLAQDHFDAVRDLAWHLPLTIVTQLVGVSRDLGEQMLQYSNARGDSFGPADHARTRAGVVKSSDAARQLAKWTAPPHLRSGSMGAVIYEAAENGLIEPHQAPALMRDYLGPSLDTTIAGIGNMIWLLAENADQWQLLKRDPKLIPAAISEALRLDSPIQFFCRTALEDVMVSGTLIKAGDRVLVMYGSANRDPAHWDEPDVMNIQRAGLAGHIGFGAGVHSCVGRHLAQMEMQAILRNIVERVDHITVHSAHRAVNNVLHAFDRLECIFE